MEAIATGLAVEAAKAVAKVVAAKPFEEITLVWGFKDHHKTLKKKVSYIQALLEDLGNGKHTAEQSRLVNAWLDRVKDVASSAENLMDDYQYEMLRRKLEPMKLNHRPSFKKKCRKYVMAPSTTPIAFRFRMTRRVSQILSKFDELDKDAKDMGLKPVKLAREAVSAAASSSAAGNQGTNTLFQVRKHANALGSDFVGREADQTELLHKLLNPPSADQADLPIIAIVGIGGLGKTTLARRIFNHEQVEEHFRNKKIWICVSENFDIDRVLNEMLESLTSRKCDLSNDGAITNKLNEELKGEKFLLILDDVWKENQELWNSLKNTLQRIGDLSKSVILITTRNTEVAKKARVVYTHRLEGLSEDDGWALLLKQNIFDTCSICQNISDFEDVGRRIVKKCKCVPLAIKAIGALLPSKKSPLEWESLLTSELWNLPQEDESSIFPSLLLSYNHLPLPVKQCFAYCAIFPKDSKLKKRVLIALWMAQGFLNELKMENDGEDHFGVLLNHSFLEEEEELNVIGEVKGYKMHDLMHDLATYVSKKDMLVLKADSKIEDVSYVRHAIINFEKEEMMPKAHIPVAKRNLRTVSCWVGVPRWDSIICARYLRVLVVANTGLSEISSTIGQLIHLRYFDLSGNKIKTLPEQICELYQLQTLRLKGNYELKELPRELYKLENLRCIQGSRFHRTASRGLGLLTNLQILPKLKLCDKDEGWTIDELKDLNQIKGKLHISGLEHVKNKENARQANLWRKDGILKLQLKWSRSIGEYNYVNTDEDVLGSLEPHPNLKSLTVEGFRGKRFPGWMKTMAVKQTIPLSNLIQVKLIYCKECEQVPTLGQLPNLKILTLLGFKKVDCIGNEFYESSNSATTNTTNVKLLNKVAKEEHVLFGALRELSILCFNNLVTWLPAVAVASVFPCLETMKISSCKKLERVPALHLQSLKHLELEGLDENQPLDIIKYNNLETLDIGLCRYLKSLPSVEMMMASLKRLHIWACRALVSIPTDIEKCTSLETLDIGECPSIEGPVPDLSKLQSLKRLRLVNSGDLMRSAALSIPHLHLLRSLTIGGFRDEEECNTFVSQMMTSTTHIRDDDASQSLFLFREVKFTKCPNVKKLPQQLEHLCPSSTLQKLIIDDFRELEELPEWIGNLSSLQQLNLYFCPKLKSLPSKPALLRLLRLHEFLIFQCELLTVACDQQNNGPESQWYKISHIPIIVVDRQIVQDLR